METKQSIVKETRLRGPYQGKNGPFFVTDVIFHNGDAGQFSHANEKQTIFQEGLAVVYIMDKKINGQHTNYYLKQAPAAAPASGTAGEKHLHYDQLDNKRVALAAAASCMAGGKSLFPATEVLQLAETFLVWLHNDKP